MRKRRRFYIKTYSIIATIVHLLTLSCVIPIAYTGLELNSFIKHFEPLYYDIEKLKHQQSRLKRSLNNNNMPSLKSDNLTNTKLPNSKNNLQNEIKLNFSAHNRLFRLVIRSDNSLFASDVVFESSTKGVFNYDTSNIIKGYLEDDDKSIVEGVITADGLIDGYIQTENEEYYIEPAERYFDTKDFHSIIYLLSAVVFPTINKSICHYFYTNNNQDSVQQSCSPSNSSNINEETSDDQSEYFSSDHPRSSGISNSNADVKTGSDTFGKIGKKDKPINYLFSQLISDWVNSKRRTNRFNRVNVSRRKKRDTAKKGQTFDKSYYNNNDNTEKPYYSKDVDSLHYTDSEPYGVRAVQRTHWTEDRHDRHVVIDPKKTTCMLYLQADHLFYEKMGSDEACIEAMTRHVQKVNSIYKTTDFDQDGRSDNISFLIKRIKVHTLDALKDPEYRYPSNYGVEKFLELFSEEDYDAFCLAYMFTYRDFEGGTLGLAWTGDLKNAGGVCEKNGHYRGSLKSLNTGIVTLLNYGKHVPPIVSHVTLAHEIGHNFGSPHDPEDDNNCTPGGEDGNYIMFARATSGDKRNNNKFSPCSLKSINAVLNTKAKSLKGCFQEPQDSICGNEVVEAGEECDCGWEEDCKEPCCFPMRSNPPHDEIPCRLRPNVICSPSQGPCCTQDCKLKVGNKCRDDNGCRTASYCNGQGPQCPLSTNKPNKTICNEEYVCYMGECTGSICMAYGLESCQCRRGPHDPITKACELCCRLPSDDSTCKSSFEWNSSPYDVPDLYAKPGTPCDNYNGYCDVFQKCREVDPSGPLATLRRLLLSNESMASLKRWFNEQWFYVAILCLITLLIVAMVVKVFGKRTLDLSKSDLVDVALEAAKQKRTTSSSLSSINGLSRSALQVQNHGNLVKTSLAFHHQHQHQQHQYYDQQQQLQQQQINHQLLHHSSSSLAHNIEYSNCPPMTLTGNGWV